MHIPGFFCLFLPFLMSLIAAASCLYAAWKKIDKYYHWMFRVQRINFFFLVLASLFLFWLLYQRDFSFQYVANYTDSYLPWYYALTAFWAGQKGSFLFWTLCMSFFGFLWTYTAQSRLWPEQTQNYFWMFFLGIQTFFLYMLITVSNPFLRILPAPANGSGLNPLLQHPGMIFHPPLLFIGYAGFTVPACLALASVSSRLDKSWLPSIRNWVLISWIFLTAGIVLGAWWSYMELGWGGYWAWDPVENSSLIPWLAATGFIHTAIIGRRRKALGRSNVFLIGLTLILCFLATFITRSGFLESLHAFGKSSVGEPLLALLVFSLVVLFIGTFLSANQDNKRLSGLFNRDGILLFMTWLLLFTAAVILIGTMWPLFSGLVTQSSVGLGKGFYNRVCLPLLTLVIFLLVICPWLGWRSWKENIKILSLIIVLFVCSILGLRVSGIDRILPLLGASSSITACLSLFVYGLMGKGSRKRRVGLAGIHFGLGVIALGVTFSGAYKQDKEIILNKGESFSLSRYSFNYSRFHEYSTPNMKAYQAQLTLVKNDQEVGMLRPERRVYRNFKQTFAEASVMTGLIDEIYATLLGFNRNKAIRLKVTIYPLVNWLWIGSIIMSLTPLVLLRKE